MTLGSSHHLLVHAPSTENLSLFCQLLA
uniref:Uncharacterized protein n=1 Tax=Arundo donax TaxID=35708 RepID=A0A0A9A9H0_ARUDO